MSKKNVYKDDTKLFALHGNNNKYDLIIPLI